MKNRDTVSVGIQNKNTLKNLFLSRLAANNNAKNRTTSQSSEKGGVNSEFQLNLLLANVSQSTE